MKLYHWNGPLQRHSKGDVVALAATEEEARRLAVAAVRAFYRENYWYEDLGEACFDAESAEACDNDLPSRYFEDMRTLSGPPSEVCDRPKALLFPGSD
jgi:hypothetical protein